MPFCGWSWRFFLVMEGCGPGTRDPAGLKCFRFRNHIQPVVYISPRIRFGKDRHGARRDLPEFGGSGSGWDGEAEEISGTAVRTA